MTDQASVLAARGRRRPNLKEEVAQHLRDQILSGALTPREKIDQDAIAEELGVSRLPVREALITLEAEGLVENVARRGSYVAPLTPNDIRDHYEMYGLLSGLAAERAAETMTEEELHALGELIDRHEATTDPREHDELNFQFHQRINKAGSSRRLTAVLRLLSNNMPTHFFEFNPEYETHAVAQHRDIHKALRARDGGAAAKAVAHHFREVGEQAVSMLRKAWDGAED